MANESVNWGVLGNIKYPEPRVVATGTSTTSTNGGGGMGNALSSLAGGIAEGLKAGAQRRYQDSETAINKEKLSEAQQLFPNQLKQSNMQTESMSMDLAGKKQAAEDMATLREASLKGPDNYAMTLQKLDPGAYQDYALKMAKTQKAFGDLAKQDADTEKEQTDNFGQAIGAAAQVVRAAASGANPQMQQQIYQFGMSQLPKKIQAAMPPTYDPNAGMAISRLAHEDQMSRIATKIESGSSSDLLKNQTIRDYVQQQIDAMNQQGANPNDPTLKQLTKQRDELNQAIQLDLTPKAGKNGENKIDPNSVEALTNKQAVATNFKEAQGANSSEVGLNKLKEDTELGQNILNKIPSNYVGPLAGRIGLGIENTDVQKLDKLLSAIPLVQKSVTLGQSAGARLFTTELDQMIKSSGSLKINVPALKWILQEIHEESQIMLYKNWNKEYSAYSTADPTLKDNWVKSHPRPDDPRIEVVTPEGKHMTIPYSQMDQYLKSTPGALRW